MFTAPYPSLSKRSIPRDSIQGALNSFGLSQRELHGWLGQKAFLPTQEYVAGCRQRGDIGINDVFLHTWKGSSPELWTSDIEWTTFYGSFLRRYIQNLVDLSCEQDFLNFMRLVAARIGQQLNFRALSEELGIPETALNTYLTFLETTALVYLLPELSENGRNRKHQTHKVYFTDTGLCAFLSGWTTKEALMDGALSDLMFENFVIIEILKSYRNLGVDPLLSYFRNKDKKEIPLLIRESGKLYPVEIKITAAPRLSMVKNFELIPENKRGEGALICFVEQDLPLIKEVSALPISYL